MAGNAHKATEAFRTLRQLELGLGWLNEGQAGTSAPIDLRTFNGGERVKPLPSYPAYPPCRYETRPEVRIPIREESEDAYPVRLVAGDDPKSLKPILGDDGFSEGGL